MRIGMFSIVRYIRYYSTAPDFLISVTGGLFLLEKYWGSDILIICDIDI